MAFILDLSIFFVALVGMGSCALFPYIFGGILWGLLSTLHGVAMLEFEK